MPIPLSIHPSIHWFLTWRPAWCAHPLDWLHPPLPRTQGLGAPMHHQQCIETSAGTPEKHCLYRVKHLSLNIKFQKTSDPSHIPKRKYCQFVPITALITTKVITRRKGERWPRFWIALVRICTQHILPPATSAPCTSLRTHPHCRCPPSPIAVSTASLRAQTAQERRLTRNSPPTRTPMEEWAADPTAPNPTTWASALHTALMAPMDPVLHHPRLQSQVKIWCASVLRNAHSDTISLVKIICMCEFARVMKRFLQETIPKFLRRKWREK